MIKQSTIEAIEMVNRKEANEKIKNKLAFIKDIASKSSVSLISSGIVTLISQLL
jgi:hypothetical protein